MISEQLKRSMHYVYKLKFPDGAVYIGCTNDVYRRFNTHLKKPPKGVQEHIEDTKYDLSDIDFVIERKVMYRKIGKRIERGLIKHLYFKTKVLNKQHLPKETRGSFEVTLSDGRKGDLYYDNSVELKSKTE